MWKKHRNMACMGIVGAALFGVGDWLIYLYPGLALENDIQPLWAEMPAWRFAGSAWCGIIGGIVMMYGAYSAYYCAGDNKEGYFIFETPETKRTLYGSFLQAKWMLSSFGLKKGIQYIKEIMNSGTYLASEFSKQKKLFTKIEFIAVAKEHQGQGYMRQMMEYAFSKSDRLGLPLILTTDDEKKVKIYEHFGMKMVREHIVSDRAIYYEMLREGNKGYRKSKLKAGGNSREPYIQNTDHVPAAFRHKRKTGKGIAEDI